MTTETVTPGLTPAQLGAIGKAHDDRVKRESRNPEGRPAARYKIRHTSTNGGRVTQRVSKGSLFPAVEALELLQLDETGEVEIEDRVLDCTWRLV